MYRREEVIRGQQAKSRGGRPGISALTGGSIETLCWSFCGYAEFIASH